MPIGRKRLTTALAGGLLLAAGSSAGQQSQPSVRAEDRAGIEDLLGRYVIALGSCNAEKYASLFVTPGGFFAAGARGRVDTRHRLTEMIKSYDCDYVNDVAPPHAPTPTPPYKLVLEPAPGGAVGVAYLNGARYEDEYVKRLGRRALQEYRRLSGFDRWHAGHVAEFPEVDHRAGLEQLLHYLDGEGAEAVAGRSGSISGTMP